MGLEKFSLTEKKGSHYFYINYKILTALFKIMIFYPPCHIYLPINHIVSWDICQTPQVDIAVFRKSES